METVETFVEAAGRHLREGEPLAAYNVAQAGLEQSPGHVRLRQLRALALARSGDVERANAELASLVAQGLDDSETLGMLARTHKDLALRAGPAGGEHLRSAFDLYERAWTSSRTRGDVDAAGYAGINAAAMASLRGERARAGEIAREVLALPDGSDPYWTAATRAEAALLVGDLAAARDHYAGAHQLARGRHGDLGSTRRQAPLLESHLRIAPPAPSSALPVAPVVVFCGHMIDAPTRASPRFPASREAEVREALVRRLGALAPVAVYGSAACGSDLLCLEAARELGCETHVVLPFPREAFRETSVDFAGGDWGARFERALDAAGSVTVTSDHRARNSAATFEYANLVFTGMARLRARALDSDVRGIAALDGSDPGAPGGTRSIVALWESGGIPVDVIGLGNGSAARTSTQPTNAAASTAGVRHEMRTLLFADAVGYSKMSEDQIPVYIERFLGAIAALARRHPPYEHVEVAGDGLYMVFRDPVEAARYALELSRLAGGTNWAAHGLPATLNLRIALHSGPVHCARDPLTGGPMYTGPHTSRAARIEPITPPGQVYASSAFAAVAAAVDAPLALSYVGRMPLAKGYGALGLYHVRGASFAAGERAA